MHKKNRIGMLCLLSIILILCAGCSNNKQVEGDQNNATTKPEVYHKAAKIDEGTLKLDSNVLAIGKTLVTYKEALIYMYQLKEQYEPSLGTDIWSYQLEEEKTFEEYAKDEVMSEITQLKIICQKAQEMGVVLEDDEKDEITQMAKEYVQGLSEADIKKYGITEELMNQIYSDNQLASKMFDITTNAVDTDISDEEAKQITIQYLMVMTKGEDKNGKSIDMSADEKVSAKKRAKKLLKEAKEEESFYNFAESNTDDSTVELTFGKADMPTEFGDAAFLLKTGEMSKLIETESGFYILYCVSDYDKDATVLKKEEIISENQNKMFEDTYADWSKQFEIAVSTSLWDQIHFVK